jgi:hypothetical protein
VDKPNIPLPDQLAALRAQIKDLQEQESDLRRILIANPDTRTGNNWLVDVKTVTSQRVDLKELRAAYPEQVNEHSYPTETINVVLRGISEDGEVVSPRKIRSGK